MEEYAEKVFQELPVFVPKLVETFSSDKVVIFKAKNVFSELKGFDSYKFIVTKTQMPDMVVEKTKLHLNSNTISPINPDQVHASTVQTEVPTYFPMLIEKEFVREISKSIYKTNNIFFQTNAFPLSPHIFNLMQLFVEEKVNRQPGCEFVLQSLNMQITVSLLREINCNHNNHIQTKKYFDHKAVKTVIDFLMENSCEHFTLDNLAKEVNYSPYHLIRIFKEHTGKTPFKFYLDMKISKAKHLLKTTSYPIIEICYLCGFNNRTHFSNVFKQKVGMSPLQYRQL